MAVYQFLGELFEATPNYSLPCALGKLRAYGGISSTPYSTQACSTVLPSTTARQQTYIVTAECIPSADRKGMVRLSRAQSE